jgi:hypothetical protein
VSAKTKFIRDPLFRIAADDRGQRTHVIESVAPRVPPTTAARLHFARRATAAVVVVVLVIV